MGKTYKYLETLDCFDLLKQKAPDMLDDFEEQMRWYEEEATDEDIGECGENLSRFLVEVYGGNNNLEELIEELAM
jgi:hypothetical protein